MSSQVSQPGKTAPRLLHDVYLFDVGSIIHNYNVLAEPAPDFDEDKPATDLIDDQACRHDFATISEHCRLPPEDYRPQIGDNYEVEAICRKCRTYVLLTLGYDSEGHRPCPNKDFPLHHFVLKSTVSQAEFGFQCTSPDCGAGLYIQYLPPRISDDDINLLTNTAALQSRYDDAVAKNVVRQGLRLASPVDTLTRLRRYICDSLKPEGQGKKIPAANKRFLESFGQGCDDLFNRLDFKYVSTGDEGFWCLPQTAPHNVNQLDPSRTELERWELELKVLIDQLCAQDGYLQPFPDFAWRDARNDLERTLAAQGYDRIHSPRRERDASGQDHPYYASLGAIRDFSDALVVFCYERQSNCDPQRALYYYDCLRGLARGRDSETLNFKAAMMESQGLVGKKDLEEAYRYIDVDPSSSDEFIVSKYRSRMDDTGLSMQGHMKVMLQRLGTARGSQRLQDAASDSLETYDQALAWLGADASMADEFVLTLHTAKVADDPSNTDMARRAVKIIADHRKSESLQSWLSTGELRESGMDIDEACRHLHIDLKSVDESMLGLVFENARKDNPGRKTDQAIEAVTRSHQRPRAPAQHAPETWPVGLTSHGNTCYLNSLLQYYFTIKRLRDIVLDFDKYKFDLQAHPTKVERVGGLKVRSFEIRAYQKFVDDLSHLFERMIKESSNAVKPEADLVCRAFLKAEDTESQAMSGNVSDAGKDDANKDVTMTSAESQTGLYQPTPLRPQDSAGTMSRPPSVASSVTLAGSADQDIPDVMSKSNILPPSPPLSRPGSTNAAETGLLQAPPLPPRVLNTPERQQTNLTKAEEAARQQQDVTEVMDEILFRLRCAINPAGMDTREEQFDLFRDIFYMRIIEKTAEIGKEPISRSEDAINILLNIPSEPTDIYSALDEVFDRQSIDHGGKKLTQYKSLQTLPPVLQINIPRNTYDRKTGRGVKVEHKMHLEDTLYMDRYFDSGDQALIDRREQCWEWRDQLRAMQAEKHILTKTSMSVDGPTAIEAAARYLDTLTSTNAELESEGFEPIEYEESIPAQLSHDAKDLRERLAAIDSRAAELKSRISAQFDGLEKMKYRLHAVFFHRGGYGHGHYWTYIHDLQNDVWRIYNDEKVDEFTKLDEIFNAVTWQHGTPTYAVYVREDVKDEYVQAVCREPEQAPVAESQLPVDEVMQDAPSAAGDTTGRQTQTQQENKVDGEWASSQTEYHAPNVKW